MYEYAFQQEGKEEEKGEIITGEVQGGDAILMRFDAILMRCTKY
jgi:hypothetical protein